MTEEQKLAPNQALCWQCGEVVYKGTKYCPKCNAPSPAVSTATQRKVSLRVVLPLGIVSLIAGFILYGTARSVDAIMTAGCLWALGFSGILVGTIMYFVAKKREKQVSAGRTAQ